MRNDQGAGNVWAGIGVVAATMALVAGAILVGLSTSKNVEAQTTDDSTPPAKAAAPATPQAPAAANRDGQLEKRVAKLETELDALRNPVSENTTNITDLGDKFDNLTDLVKHNIQQRLDAISEPDRSNEGYYVPKVYGNMETSPYFSDQMEKAVDQTMKSRQCKLRIINKTTTSQLVRINDQGAWMRLDPDQQIEQEFPAGAVTTRLFGQNPVSWFLGPPNYRQDVQIVIR